MVQKLSFLKKFSFFGGKINALLPKKRNRRGMSATCPSVSFCHILIMKRLYP